jgi:hypothetical protein
MNPENFDPEIHFCDNKWTQVQLAKYNWKKDRSTYASASKPPAADEPGSEEYKRPEWAANILTGAEYLKMIVKPSKDEAYFVSAQLCDQAKFDFAKSDNDKKTWQALIAASMPPIIFADEIYNLMASEPTKNSTRS